MTESAQRSDGGVFHLIARIYTRGMMTLGCTLLAVTVIVMGVEVFFRYALNNSIIWAKKISQYLLI